MKKTTHKQRIKDILLLKAPLSGLVLFYQKAISPLKPKTCIYYPTCSSYMLEAILRHGAVKGVLLGVKRLLRCVPWKKGGFDPVPDNPKGDMKWLF